MMYIYFQSTQQVFCQSLFQQDVMAGEIVPGDRIPLKYRPFCVSLFRQLFSRACGYGKGKAFTCLCQWCEDFGEQQFDLLEKLLQQVAWALCAGAARSFGGRGRSGRAS